MKSQRRSAFSKPCTGEGVRVLGLDASLRSTGYAYTQNGTLVSGVIEPGKLTQSWRLCYIRNQLSKLLQKASPSLVVLEDYAMGAGGRNNNNVFKMGELGGVIKLYLWESGVDVLLVAPTTMKSVIALSGRADKKDISRALASRFDINVTQHDEADAVGLMLVGEMKCGIREVQESRADRAKSNRFASIQKAEILRGQLKLITTRLAQT